MTSDVEVRRATAESPSDAELEALLWQVYVEGGFTTPEHATAKFVGKSLRDGGELFVAVRVTDKRIVGTVNLVSPDSPLVRLGLSSTNAELQLLAVAADFRGQAIGRRLVVKAIEHARQKGFEAITLWTQPTMKSAHRIYSELGFIRKPEFDFSRDDRDFLVMQLEL